VPPTFLFLYHIKKEKKMKYNKFNLIKQLKSKEFPFYSFDSGPLALDFYSPMVIDDQGFCCILHFLAYKKAELFGDTKALKWLKTGGLQETLHWYLNIKNVVPDVWNIEKKNFLLKALNEKFKIESFKEYLLQTEEDVLVFANTDKINIEFSAGFNLLNHYHIDDPEQWSQDNILGFSLMKIRDKLLHVDE
jgi:predicted NAD-dependent protein-ADP-ribosyltransferase YbiA (DUF1768 family)